jgi:hypothetical protein
VRVVNSHWSARGNSDAPAVGSDADEVDLVQPLAICRTSHSRTPSGSFTCTERRESPKYERAALRWLESYLADGVPELKHFAEVASSLAKRDPGADGPN